MLLHTANNHAIGGMGRKRRPTRRLYHDADDWLNKERLPSYGCRIEDYWLYPTLSI